MFSTSLALVITFSLLLCAEGAPNVPLETTSSQEWHLELQFDHVKRAQLGITLTDVSIAVKWFINDKCSYKLSDLQKVAVTSWTTGKTHNVKELGGIDVQFTHIGPEELDNANEERRKTERGKKGAGGEEWDAGKEDRGREENDVTVSAVYLQLDGDKCLQRGLDPKEIRLTVKRFLKNKDSYKLSDIQNFRVTSRKTGKTYKAKELGEIDVQFTLIRTAKANRAKDEPGKTEPGKNGKSERKECQGAGEMRRKVANERVVQGKRWPVALASCDVCSGATGGAKR